MSLAAGREQWKPRHDDAAVIKDRTEVITMFECIVQSPS